MADYRAREIAIAMTPALEITPQEVKRKLDSGEAVSILDVREPAEYQQARIEGAMLVPMNTVPAALQELDAKAGEALLVVYCHHGVRSLNVANWLRNQGVENVVSMAGGIDRWSLEIDPSVPRYF
jgi:rhodanese-related sulfurtransferase